MKSLLFFGMFAVVILLGLFLVQQRSFNDGKLHIVFCDVGQGDAVYIRTPGGSDILYDGGPDQRVLGCLTKYMPFWDRNIELVMLSHPHADHLTGMLDILDRYTVSQFATEKLGNDTPEYRELEKQLLEREIARRYLYAGDRFRVDDVVLSVLGPSQEYLVQTSPDGKINSSEFASLIVGVTHGEFDVLLTGDSQSSGLSETTTGMESIDVLQVPHHGSRTGFTSEILSVLKPKMAVISVGKNNYGHPSKETLKLLQESDSKVVRTDRKGDIEIVSDGRAFQVY